MTIGSNIKKLRTTNNLTQEQLAERLHVTRQTVSSWEVGKSRPDFDLLEAIADTLDTNVMTLLYGPEASAPLSRKRILVPVICTAIAVMLWIIMALWLDPEIENVKRTFDIMPKLLYHLIFLPFATLIGTVLLCSLAGLRWDISLPHRQRRICLGIGLVLSILYTSLALPQFLDINSSLPRSVMFFPNLLWHQLINGKLCIFTGIACGIFGYLACNPSRKIHPPNGDLPKQKKEVHVNQ